ncbi:MAG: aminotransferase class III-fold pyridoxal phosphate-dependent enzyme, partial [Amylibacter sp.]|nr:aminotransferase class III-fold pyridoxal phosphate-dependent enzyme [Amylibacter sp.]
IIEERELVAHAAELGAVFQKSLREFESHPLVGEARGVGLIGALDLVTDKAAKKGLDAPGQLGGLANVAFMENGVMSRNMLDAMAFCPPLIITEAQVKDMLQRVEVALDQVAKKVL